MLLNALRIRRCKRCEELRFELWREFPSLGCEIDAAAVLCCLGKVADGPLVEEWRRAVAEELLLAKSTEALVSDDLLKEFGETSPFGNEITLRDVWDLPAACAVFPLAHEKPGIGHVWVIKGLDHRDPVNGAEQISRGVGICTSTTEPRWSGKSWQLAGRLAEEAIGFPERTYVLRDFVITGCVNGSRISHVDGLESKLKVLWDKRWVLPRENRADDEFDEMRKSLRYVYTESTVTAAVNLVFGERTRPSHPRFNLECDEMHALVGGAPEPVIAAFLLSNARMITLWYSEKTRSTAEFIKGVIDGLEPGFVVLPKQMPSRSVVEAEDAMWQALQHRSSKQICINITGGNRLMSFAAHTMAKLFDNVYLVYRDVDAEEHTFLEVYYEEDNASEANVYREPERFESIQWSHFYKDNRDEKYTAETFLDVLRGGKCT